MTIKLNKKPAFIPFIMAGCPNLQATFECIKALEEIGADAIEIGVPFSDPIADGPINQAAAATALQQNVNLTACLDLIAKVRREGHTIPLILFSYYNPLYAFGLTAFAKAAKAAGVDSVLVVDLPVFEADKLYKLLQAEQIGMIFLASPTTDAEHLRVYQTLPPDFLYYVSRLGVTGVQKMLSPTLPQEVLALRKQLDLPICIGFGISTPEQAKQAAELGDGVIIGSALVQVLQQTYATQGLKLFVELVKEFYREINPR